MAKGRKEAVRAIAVFAGEPANADIYQELLRQHVVP
jgi:hypothetical protein